MKQLILLPLLGLLAEVKIYHVVSAETASAGEILASTAADFNSISTTPLNTTTNLKNGSVSVAITSTSTDKKSARTNTTIPTSANTPVLTSTATSITPSTLPVDDVRTTSSAIPSTSSTTQKPSIRFSEDYSTLIATSTDAAEGGLFNSIGTKEITMLLLLFVAVVIIVVAVILVIRKRKHDKRNNGSFTPNKEQSGTVVPTNVSVVPVITQSEDAAPPGNTISADVEMTQRATPSNNTAATPSNNADDSSVQPIDTVIDIDKNVVSADLDLQKKDQQGIETTDQVDASPSPNHTQPCEPSTSPSCPVNAEPLKPDEESETVAPVHSNDTIRDQQNIPETLSDPTGKEVKALDSIDQEATEIKPGAEKSVGDDTSDPSAIDAELINLKEP